MNTALRQGAIRLACIHPDDQRWILDNLQPSEREQIEALLEEVSLLGLASDPSIVDAVMREVPVPRREKQSSPLDENAHPFWLALGVMAVPEEQRSLYLEQWRGKAGLSKWSSAFSSEVLPSALVQHLSDLLRRGDDHGAA